MSAIHDERRRRLKAAMEEAGAETLVVVGNAWHNDYMRYVTDYGVTEGDAIAVVHADGETTLLVEGAMEADRAEAGGAAATVVAADDLISAAKARLGALGNRAVFAAPGPLLPWGLQPGPDDAPFADGTALLDRLLMIKSAPEIEAVKRATALADAGYRVFMEAAKVGRAEYELVAEVEAFFRSQGCADNFMLIGSGGKELRGMTPASERRLQPGDLLITELSPAVEGYYSQLCRTMVIGEPTKTQIDAYRVYQDAVEAGLGILKAGVTAAEIAKAENDVFRERGLGVYCTSEYTRVRGHGLGLFVDNKPHILEDVDTVLEAGAVLVVHPNTYHPEAGYMVLGDASVVTDDGYLTFSATPRELLVAAG
jgi:Xaa-Pro dipeptidase